MNLQPRHYPHLMIIVITMIGTGYFLHKSDQKKLNREAAFAREKIEFFDKKPEKKKEVRACKDRPDGYRCFTRKTDSK